MKTIKIFLASSVVEFKKERQELAAFVNSFNNICFKNGIFLKLEKCEDVSDVVELERKRKQHSKRIKKSDYLLMLIGRDVEQYTIEEFGVALEHFQEHGTPKILPYFKKFPEGEQAGESVVKFMERLDKQLGHFYKQYTELSEVKMKFIMEILRDVGVGSALEIQDGQMLWKEQRVMSLEDVPLYRENRGLQQKQKQKKALDEEYAALLPKLAESLADDGLLERKGKLEQERGAIQEVIYQMERDMFRVCQETDQKRQLGMHMNWREKKAVEFVDKGDYESAKNILRDSLWEEEIRQAGENIKQFTGEKRERQLVDIRRYILGKETLISYIKIARLTPESMDEIKTIYENITEKAMEYQMEQRVMQEYAEFLTKEGYLEEGIAVGEKLRQYYKNDKEMLNRYKAEFLLRLSNWYWNVGETKKSKQCIREALKIISFISNDLERECLEVSAAGYMVICMREMGHVENAEKLSRLALERSTSLWEENPKDNTLRWILGRNMLNYVSQMLRMAKSKGQKSEAEEYCQKAVEIYEDLTENYSDDSWCSLFPDREGMTCDLQEAYRYSAYVMCNAGVGTRSRRREAENLYRKSLEIGRTIAAKDPWVNKRSIALSCKGLANLLEKNDRDEEAKDLYQESWEISQSLSAKYPKKYKNFAAKTCIEYAGFLERKKRKLYWSPFDDFYEGEESWDIYREGLLLYEGEKDNSDNSFDGCNSNYLYMKAKVKLGEAAQMSRDVYRFVPDLSYTEEWYAVKLNYEYERHMDVTVQAETWSMRGRLGRFRLDPLEVDAAFDAVREKNREWFECELKKKRIRRKVSWAEWLESRRPKSKEIEVLFQQALAILQELDKRKDIQVPQWDFFLYYEERGNMLWKLMNRAEEADKMYEKACEIARNYEDKAAYKMSVSRIYLKRAITLAAMGRMWESEEFMQKSRKCEVRYEGVWGRQKTGGKSR